MIQMNQKNLKMKKGNPPQYQNQNQLKIVINQI